MRTRHRETRREAYLLLRKSLWGVLMYGERIHSKGLNLLSAPGNDLVAATALASAGCQLVLFTTGRGTPFGSFVPTMKISTNSKLAVNKPKWIDFNAGSLVENDLMEDIAERFIRFVIDVREIAIFKSGVTL